MRRLPRYLLAPLMLSLLAACTPPGPPPGGSIAEFQKLDTVAGDGAEAVAGHDVTVHYSGWLYDENAADKHGRKFDSSLDRGEPFTVPLGAGKVIRGWDEGVAGMKVGGRRRITIPPTLGYGKRGYPPVIAPDETLVFVVDLVGVR